MRVAPLLAVGASVAVVVAAPFVGQIRAAVQQALPGRYVAVLAIAVGAAVAVALGAALLRIRDRRVLRYGLLAAAIAAGVLYARVTGTGIPEVDAVERFHFVEYGALAVLYHRVWRDRADASSVALPLLAGILVGTADEFLQWFVPGRVGEMRDVALNGAALACGLLFALGLHPPKGFALVREYPAARRLAAAAAATLVACALFFHVVHLGHEVRVAGDAGAAHTAFRSRFTAGELAAAADDRAARWRAGVPSEGAFTREDQYLSEGRWHIEERNDAAAAGDLPTAWREELILETFFEPVLGAVPAARWPPEQRAAAAASGVDDAREYASAAHPFPIYDWHPLAVWVPVASTLTLIAWAVLRTAKRPRRVREAV